MINLLKFYKILFLKNYLDLNNIRLNKFYKIILLNEYSLILLFILLIFDINS
jgi:hypothetical protein